MTSVDQGSGAIPFEEVSYAEDRVLLRLGGGALEIEGAVDLQKGTITGEFKQGGGAFPIHFEPVDELPRLSRPQDPKPPFPYLEEEVTYENTAAQVTLAATLTLPESGAPFPAAILLTGSGPQNRDEELFGHKPFRVLADHLARKGIAVLRADDRGMGGSTGDFRRSTTLDFARDALAGVAFLKSREEIDPERIGLIGHSEGAIMAPIAAVESDDVAFVVMLAGLGVGFDEVVIDQMARRWESQGMDDDVVARKRSWRKSLYAVSGSALEEEAAATEIRKLFADLDDDERSRLGWSSERLEKELPGLLRPWWRYAMAYDPRATLRQVRCPVLALGGEKDTQVRPGVHLPAIEAALKEGESPRFEVRELAGLNHLFQTAETGAESEYVKIEETMSPAAMDLAVDWILALSTPLASGSSRDR
jgi:pimeloyl-ACP methyl ester carboxylesterase